MHTIDQIKNMTQTQRDALNRKLSNKLVNRIMVRTFVAGLGVSAILLVSAALEPKIDA